jgi:serine/threonine-protein kinase
MHYLVWPLVEGETLDAVVQRSGKLTPEHTAQIASQIAQGLAVCHQHGLFHGLLKPSNVMIGGDGQARILDFGIGSLLVENEGESLVDTMSTANTLTSGLDCTSPESIMEPTNRTPAGDQYSLGCTMYFCLAGRFPFPEGSAVEKMMAHQFRQPTPLKDLAPDAPDELIAVVDKLMQKSPDNRYGSLEELVEVLQAMTPAGQPTHTPAPIPPRPSPRTVMPTPERVPAVGSAPRPPVETPATRRTMPMPTPPAPPPMTATPTPGPVPARVPGRADFSAAPAGSGVLPPPPPPAAPMPPPLPPRTRSQAEFVYQPPMELPAAGDTNNDDERIVIGPVGMAAVTVVVAVVIYVVGAVLMR